MYAHTIPNIFIGTPRKHSLTTDTVFKCTRLHGDALKEAKEAEEKAGAAGGGGRRDGAAGGGGNRGKVKKIGPNEKCPCGGGKKYKKCHGAN